ncbi:hypothetical protein HPB50_004810 [Hyalomma asiaticum]|uniref:Uncharacterized protein n=1 Tax=Hyalomma asiaticum TaxID=266040 RepID=A0ACB7SMP7_HYAAI|nr:hypothetical protein HPB50_004810 [Hyalomma asiaticum]
MYSHCKHKVEEHKIEKHSPLLRKALQRERLQAMRQNPTYREMERLRQRSMMQLKRQDPSFRALERERQRARMQLRRQDPSFRAMERERQRRRMRLKRRDPAFREREREQQKTRLLVKRSGDKLPVALDASSSSSSTPVSTPAISTQAPSSQLSLPAPPHQQTSGHALQSHTTAHHPSSSHPQSQQSTPQQHGKGTSTLSNCLVPHDIQKRDATALYGHLQRIVGYHNLLQARPPHSEEPGSSFKSPYFGGEPSSSLMGRRMVGAPQGHHGSGGGSSSSSKGSHPSVGGGRQKGFLDGGPCHPLGEMFAASYPTMRDQGLAAAAGAQPCGSLDGPPLLHAATSAEGGGGRGSSSHPAAILGSGDMLPSVPDCPECLEAQRQRSQCGLCQGEDQQAVTGGRPSGRRQRSSRQSTERFRCTVCAKEFGMKHHLKEHYKSHGDRNLCCPHCDYRTCYGYALRRHVIIRHDRPAARQAQMSFPKFDGWCERCRADGLEYAVMLYPIGPSHVARMCSNVECSDIANDDVQMDVLKTDIPRLQKYFPDPVTVLDESIFSDEECDCGCKEMLNSPPSSNSTAALDPKDLTARHNASVTISSTANVTAERLQSTAVDIHEKAPSTSNINPSLELCSEEHRATMCQDTGISARSESTQVTAEPFGEPTVSIADSAPTASLCTEPSVCVNSVKHVYRTSKTCDSTCDDVGQVLVGQVREPTYNICNSSLLCADSVWMDTEEPSINICDDAPLRADSNVCMDTEELTGNNCDDTSVTQELPLQSSGLNVLRYVMLKGNAGGEAGHLSLTSLVSPQPPIGSFDEMKTPLPSETFNTTAKLATQACDGSGNLQQCVSVALLQPSTSTLSSKPCGAEAREGITVVSEVIKSGSKSEKMSDTKIQGQAVVFSVSGIQKGVQNIVIKLPSNIVYEGNTETAAVNLKGTRRRTRNTRMKRQVPPACADGAGASKLRKTKATEDKEKSSEDKKSLPLEQKTSRTGSAVLDKLALINNALAVPVAKGGTACASGGTPKDSKRNLRSRQRGTASANKAKQPPKSQQTLTQRGVKQALSRKRKGDIQTEQVVPDILQPVLSPTSSEFGSVSSKPSQINSSGTSSDAASSNSTCKTGSSVWKSISSCKSAEEYVQLIKNCLFPMEESGSGFPGYHPVLATRPPYNGDKKPSVIAPKRRRRNATALLRQTTEAASADVNLELDRYVSELSGTTDTSQFNSVLSELFDCIV